MLPGGQRDRPLTHRWCRSSLVAPALGRRPARGTVCSGTGHDVVAGRQVPKEVLAGILTGGTRIGYRSVPLVT